MTLNRNDKAVLMWLGTVACLGIAFVGFALVAPWTFDVMSVGDAAARCPGIIDPSWPAVVCSHSRPSKWEPGLIRDNPFRYGAAVLQMVAGLIAWNYGMKRTKAFMRAQ